MNGGALGSSAVELRAVCWPQTRPEDFPNSEAQRTRPGQQERRRIESHPPQAGGRGFEPRHTDSESAVLPLDEPPRIRADQLSSGPGRTQSPLFLLSPSNPQEVSLLASTLDLHVSEGVDAEHRPRGPGLAAQAFSQRFESSSPSRRTPPASIACSRRGLVALTSKRGASR